MIVTLQTLVFFRESFFNAIDRLVRPYYKQLSLGFFSGSGTDLEDEEDQVFSEFDDEKGVTFYPPMYAQRYAAVSDCLLDERWCGKIEKVLLIYKLILATSSHFSRSRNQKLSHKPGS